MSQIIHHQQQQLTFVTLKCFVVGRFDRSQDVAQFNGSILHLCHARCQPEAPEFRREIMTGACLLAQTTLAWNFDVLTARGVRTRSTHVTHCVARVLTQHPIFCAVLLAHIAFDFARTSMADFNAFMLATFQGLVTGQATAEILLATRDYVSLFMATVTIFLCETRRDQTHVKKCIWKWKQTHSWNEVTFVKAIHGGQLCAEWPKSRW